MSSNRFKPYANTSKQTNKNKTKTKTTTKTAPIATTQPKTPARVDINALGNNGCILINAGCFGGGGVGLGHLVRFVRLV